MHGDISVPELSTVGQPVRSLNHGGRDRTTGIQKDLSSRATEGCLADRRTAPTTNHKVSRLECVSFGQNLLCGFTDPPPLLSQLALEFAVGLFHDFVGEPRGAIFHLTERIVAKFSDNFSRFLVRFKFLLRYYMQDDERVFVCRREVGDGVSDSVLVA